MIAAIGMIEMVCGEVIGRGFRVSRERESAKARARTCAGRRPGAAVPPMTIALITGTRLSRSTPGAS